MPFSVDYSDFIKFKRIQTEVVVGRNIDSRKKRAGVPNTGYTPTYQLVNLPPNIFTPGRLVPQPSPPQEYVDGDFVFSDSEKTILIRYSGDISSVTSLSIPSTTKTISSGVFNGCASLTSLILPGDLETIGSSAFEGCIKLAVISIPSKVTNLGSRAFKSCESLIDLSFGSGLTEIPDSAFYNCSSLTSLTIPNTITTIHDRSFYNCSSLVSLMIGSGITDSSYIGDLAFYLPTGSALTSTGLSTSFTLTSQESIRIFGVDLFPNSFDVLVDFANTDTVTNILNLPNQSSIKFKFENVLTTESTGLLFEKTGYDFTGATLIVSLPDCTVDSTTINSNDAGFMLSSANPSGLAPTWILILNVPSGGLDSLDKIQFG